MSITIDFSEHANSIVAITAKIPSLRNRKAAHLPKMDALSLEELFKMIEDTPLPDDFLTEEGRVNPIVERPSMKKGRR